MYHDNINFFIIYPYKENMGRAQKPDFTYQLMRRVTETRTDEARTDNDRVD